MEKIMESGGKEGGKIRKPPRCEHGRNKYACKECGGKAICSHGVFKAGCRRCGGSAFCEHGRHKYFCKECGGAGCCKHGNRKFDCKECGGKRLNDAIRLPSKRCQHGRIVGACMECGGPGFCVHNRRKAGCSECGGSAFCEHRNRKSVCKEPGCVWAEPCKHARRRLTCRLCKSESKAYQAEWGQLLDGLDSSEPQEGSSALNATPSVPLPDVSQAEECVAEWVECDLGPEIDPEPGILPP